MNGIERMVNGSGRAKHRPTPRQDKWKDPFYAFARGKLSIKSLFPHKINSIRESLQGARTEVKTGFFGRIKNAIVSFFRLNRSRKGLV